MVGLLSFCSVVAVSLGSGTRLRVESKGELRDIVELLVVLFVSASISKTGSGVYFERRNAC